MKKHCLQIIFAALLANNLFAVPEIRTIPVSVSNTVSGAFETIPITFRFGETNGVVERLEGDRFVPVPIKGLVVPRCKVEPVSVPDYLMNYEFCPWKLYSVPNSFFVNAFPSESAFRDYTVYMLNSNSWADVRYHWAEQKVGFVAATPELDNAFKEHVLHPVLERLLYPDSWELVPLPADGKECLYLKGYHSNDFVGLWWYCSARQESGVIKDVFKPCSVSGSIFREVCVGPRNFETGSESCLSGPFMFNSANGEVFRGNENRFSLIESEDSNQPDVKIYPPLPAKADLSRLAGITIPVEVRKGEWMAELLIRLEQAIDSATGKTGYVDFVNDFLDSENVPPYPASRIWCPSFSRNMDAKEAVEYLFADFTGLMRITGCSNRIDVLSYGAYTQKVSRAFSYRIPKQISKYISTEKEWTTWLDLDRWESLRVESFNPVSLELVVRSDFCDFERICEYLNYLYKRFPHRYKLENRTINGKPELYLVDSYRNITRRYRSWMENGQRRERFELVK